MLPTIFVVAAGFICGLLLLHWLALAFVSFGLSVAYVLVSPWNWLLAPKWFGLLIVFQLAYLAGVLLKVTIRDAESSKSGLPAGPDEKPGGRNSRGGSPAAAAHVPSRRARAWHRSARQWVLTLCRAIKAT
jgi:hypothetical protein